MRKVTKYFDKIPDSLANQQNDLKNITKEQSEKLKHDGEDVKEALGKIYHKKCAYCERRSDIEVEHYRPKRSVNTENLPKNQKAGDYGYYWLRIEWSNLLYACHECNKTAAKGTRFPLEDNKKRIKAPKFDKTTGLPTNTKISDLDEIEKPLLINPEVTEPRNHLAINAIGEIYAINQSKQGEATIAVCRLHREPLLLARRTIIDNFAERIKTQLDNYMKAKERLSIAQLKNQVFFYFSGNTRSRPRNKRLYVSSL